MPANLYGSPCIPVVVYFGGTVLCTNFCWVLLNGFTPTWKQPILLHTESNMYLMQQGLWAIRTYLRKFPYVWILFKGIFDHHGLVHIFISKRCWLRRIEKKIILPNFFFYYKFDKYVLVKNNAKMLMQCVRLLSISVCFFLLNIFPDCVWLRQTMATGYYG